MMLVKRMLIKKTACIFQHKLIGWIGNEILQIYCLPLKKRLLLMMMRILSWVFAKKSNPPYLNLVSSNYLKHATTIFLNIWKERILKQIQSSIEYQGTISGIVLNFLV